MSEILIKVKIPQTITQKEISVADYIRHELEVCLEDSFESVEIKHISEFELCSSVGIAALIQHSYEGDKEMLTELEVKNSCAIIREHLHFLNKHIDAGTLEKRLEKIKKSAEAVSNGEA